MEVMADSKEYTYIDFDSVGQAELLGLSIDLKEGMCINIPSAVIVRCAKGELTSLLHDRLTLVDMKNFIFKIQINWGVTLTHNVEDDTYTMYKKEKNPTLR